MKDELGGKIMKELVILRAKHIAIIQMKQNIKCLRKIHLF